MPSREPFVWADGFDPQDRPWQDHTPMEMDRSKRKALPDDALKDAFYSAQFAMSSAALALEKLDRALCEREGLDPEWGS